MAQFRVDNTLQINIPMNVTDNIKEIILAIIALLAAAAITIRIYRKSSKNSKNITIKNSQTGDVSGRDMYKSGGDINL